jgi:hypothetical protein
MYSGNLLYQLVTSYRIHLLQGHAGYFNQLKDFYLRHDFPPEFTDRYPPPIPDDLIQQSRNTNDELVVNKLIDSLLKEYSVDSSLNSSLIDRTKALNYYYFPEENLNLLLTELKKVGYSMGNHEIKVISTNETPSNQVSVSTRDRLSSVVVKGCSKLLKDFPFEKNVFVMMKFPDKDNPSTEDKLLDKIWDSINSTLNQSYGVRVLRADKKDYSQGGWLWDNVCVYMESSKYGIAVLENLSSSEFNPNVAIEFGYMKGLCRNVLLLKEKSFNNIRADLIGHMWKEFSAISESIIEVTVSAAIHSWAVDIGLHRVSI